MKALHKILISGLLVAICSSFSCRKSDQRESGAPSASNAATIQVAVAGNFTGPFKEIARRFEEQTSIRVVPSFGSTGKLYAQIRHGAPFDAFFAADVKRPQFLEENGLIIPGSRFTYAVGRLVLWSSDTTLTDPENVLETGEFKRLALANPALAPYGEAAKQVLVAKGLWEGYADRLVRGESVNQAFQFVSSGNAEIGFVALSQIQIPGTPASGVWWETPQDLYKPITQQAVLLTYNESAPKFMDFVKSPEIKAFIQSYGYSTP